MLSVVGCGPRIAGVIVRGDGSGALEKLTMAPTKGVLGAASGLSSATNGSDFEVPPTDMRPPVARMSLLSCVNDRVKSSKDLFSTDFSVPLSFPYMLSAASDTDIDVTVAHSNSSTVLLPIDDAILTSSFILIREFVVELGWA